jgi:phosphatidate cytidylyltransferase
MPNENTVKTRMITAAALLIPVVAIILWGGLLLKLLSVVFFAAINYEYFSSFVFSSRIKILQFTIVNSFPVLGYFLAGEAGIAGGLILSVLVALSLFVLMVDADPHQPAYEHALPATMLGLCYAGLLGTLLVVAASTIPGTHILWLLLTVTCADSCAYFGGSAIGGAKLAPRISPNKTVSGAFCGLIGAALGSLICGWLLALSVPLTTLLPYGLVVGVLAMFGDLSESMLKRAYGLKDTGQLLPGHGGLLDRLDALLFSIPVLFFLC